MATTYLTMLEKTDNASRLPASEFNEIKDALTDGTKAITTQCVKIKASNYSTSGALNVGGLSTLNSSGGVLTMTLAAPSEAGIECTISLVTAGNNATVTCAAGVTVDGTNNRMTFSTASQTIILRSISTTRWVIVQNIGSVALSAV